MSKLTKLITILGIIAGLGIITTPLSNVGATPTTSQTDTISVTIGSSCELSYGSTAHSDGDGAWGSGTTANTLSATRVNNSASTNLGSTSFSVSCNDGGGSKVSLTTTSLTSDDDSIDFSGSEPNATTSSWGINDGSSWLSSGDNVWSSESSVSGSTFSVTYGVGISPTQSAGTYAGTATYTLTHPYTEPTGPFTVSYYVDGVKVYSEEVAKGGNVKNVPTIPAKGSYRSEWSNDGTNIQSNLNINAKYYYLLTFGMYDSTTVEFATLSTNSYKLYETAGNTISFSPKSITVNSTAIVTATNSHPTYTNSVWWIDLQPYNAGSYTITGDTTIEFQVTNACVAKGSKISMADGTTKNVEDIKVGDDVLGYDYYNGSMSATKVYSVMAGTSEAWVFTVTLEDGKTLQIVDNEYLFDVDAKEFILVDIRTYQDYVGRSVMVNNNSAISSSKIASITSEMREIEHYSIITETFTNYIANGMVARVLSYFVNDRYVIGDDFKIDTAQYIADVAKYGVYTYEEFADACTRETFDKLGVKDYKIVVEKGLISFEDFKQGVREWQREIDYYANLNRS